VPEKPSENRCAEEVIVVDEGESLEGSRGGTEDRENLTYGVMFYIGLSVSVRLGEGDVKM
jgi:hypothetical protein